MLPRGRRRVKYGAIEAPDSLGTSGGTNAAYIFTRRRSLALRQQRSASVPTNIVTAIRSANGACRMLMSALGQKQTFRSAIAMSALPPCVDGSELARTFLNVCSIGRCSHVKRTSQHVRPHRCGFASDAKRRRKEDANAHWWMFLWCDPL